MLFVSLALELIAFPLPGEATMAYCGFLAYQGRLNLFLCIAVASLGVISGVTLSYFFGRTVGYQFLKKFGKYIHLGPEKLESTSVWFEKYGRRLLLITYFIPGIRHITGYLSGMTKIPFKKFAVRAYAGAFLWTGTFIFLGKTLGPDWEKFFTPVKKYLVIFIAAIIVSIAGFYIYKGFSRQIQALMLRSLYFSVKVFHTMGKIKIALVFIALAFIGLSALVIGLVQDFLAKEFSQFDFTVNLLVGRIFPSDWSIIMNSFEKTSSVAAVLIIFILATAWILLKGSEKLLEINYLLFVTFGGEALNLGLRYLFDRSGSSGLLLISSIKNTFPSGQSFMAVVAYGFLIFLLFRHSKSARLNLTVLFSSIIICFFTGLSPLFYHKQFPSDVAAGYVFGGVWLCLNIILLEVFRILPKIPSDQTH